ncbi:MAG: HEAT repeat domain-containing protein [Lysobacterales bacterium]
MKSIYAITFLLLAITRPVNALDSLYELGQQALRDKQWSTAVDLFESAQDQRERVDGSLYWRAYALSQMGRTREATGVARQMIRRFPDSTWADDAQALLDELGESVGHSDHEQLTLFALSRLIERDIDRALPLIEKMLADNPSPETRRHLLFILASSETERGSQLVMDIAVSSSEPELQIQAIHLLGAGSGESALPKLAQIYRASRSDMVRRAVIDAHVAADEPGQLISLIKGESNPDLQRHAIVSLGAMGQTDALKTIYGNLSGTRERAAVLEALAISGDVSQLAGIIESETDPQLRVTSIRSLGIADDRDSAELLAKLAETASSDEEMRAILEAVVIMDGGADIVLAVARRNTSAEISRQAIQTLAILDEGDAVVALYEELKGQSPEVDRAMLEAVMIMDSGSEIAADIASTSADDTTVAMALQTLGVMDQSHRIAELYPTLRSPELKRVAQQYMLVGEQPDGLLNILSTENDPGLRAEAIRSLAVLDIEADEELLGIYRSGNHEEKQAVIETWMIQESEEVVIQALETETDAQFKRRLLEILVVMDSEAADEYLFQWMER